ncbi:25138_t:CDS:2, partial [Gigaspora margarita]
KTHKDEGTVRANALTKRKQIQEDEHKKITGINITKQQNKNPNNVNTSLTWDDKVELELNALKDTTNIWNNSYTELSKMNKEESQKPPTEEINPENILDEVPQTEQMIEQELTWDPIKEKDQDTISLQDKVNNGNEKHEIAEQVPHHAPTPDIVMDDIEINMSNTEVQTQTVIECPMEEESQANTGSSMVMNDMKMGKTELLEKDPIIQNNENLRDDLDTLSPTGNATVQSIGHSNPYFSEHILEPTIAGWLQLEGFTSVVSKKSAASRKSILIDKSISQELENR